MHIVRNRLGMARGPAAALLILLPLLTACGSSGRSAAPPARPGEITVAATTTVVGDVVGQIGGEGLRVVVLLPVGSDPHSFEPTPQDVAAVSEARLVFANGLGLEAFLEPLIESAGAADRVVSVSAGIQPRKLGGSGGETAAGGTKEDDPHVWLNPENVLQWVDVIEAALSEVDPPRADDYAANAERYRQSLTELDQWVAEQVNTIPPERRVLVTDHDELGYFADRYGFELMGTVMPGFSTLAEPSAQDLAALEEAIRQHSLPAIFVGTTVNPALVKRITDDTGIKLVSLYIGSLSEPGGPAATYLDLMRYDTTAIVDGLR